MALFSVLWACGNKTRDLDQYESFEPNFVLKDSLVIDYLGMLSLMDIKVDGSEYLLYDHQRKELLRVNADGEILLNKNLTSDSKDGYGSYFFSCHYMGEKEIVVFTYNEAYVYDNELNLVKSLDLPFYFETNTVGGGHVNLLLDETLFTNSVAADVSNDFLKEEDYLASYPFLTVYDMKKEEVMAREPIPSGSQLIKNPGEYRETAPFSLVYKEQLYLLFSYSPEIYKYSFPEMELLETIELSPGKDYVQAEPTPRKGDGLGKFFNELASSNYVCLYESNGYLITSFLGGAPKEEVDALPKDVVGGEDFMRVMNKYKIPYYQIISDGKKLWEGHLDIDFRYKGGRLFAARNVNLPHVEEELDHVAFYFYDIE